MHEGEIESEEEEQRIDWYAHTLREHGPEDIHDTLAKAFRDLMGKPFDVSIVGIDFAPKWAGLNAETAESAEFVLHIPHGTRRGLL